MKLSTRGRYAVMAMADLAMHYSGKPISLSEISDRQEISLSYLEQLFGQLRKKDLVQSVRGPCGGYVLARNKNTIRISEIILSVNEPIAATRCKPDSEDGCRKDRAQCITHDLWEELGNQIHFYLSSVTLEDIINSKVIGKGTFYITNQANHSNHVS